MPLPGPEPPPPRGPQTPPPAGGGAAAARPRTWTGRSCTWVGRHCTLRLLQQPEQRCTSTHGGHTRKLALVWSMRRREISNTSVRVLHSAITAGSATVGEPEGRGDPRQEGGPAQSPRPAAQPSGAALALGALPSGPPSPTSFHSPLPPVCASWMFSAVALGQVAEVPSASVSP